MTGAPRAGKAPSTNQRTAGGRRGAAGGPEHGRPTAMPRPSPLAAIAMVTQVFSGTYWPFIRQTHRARLLCAHTVRGQAVSEVPALWNLEGHRGDRHDRRLGSGLGRQRKGRAVFTPRPLPPPAGGCHSASPFSDQQPEGSFQNLPQVCHEGPLHIPARSRMVPLPSRPAPRAALVLSECHVLLLPQGLCTCPGHSPLASLAAPSRPSGLSTNPDRPI